MRNISIYNNTVDNSRIIYTMNPTGFFFDYPSISNITVRNNIVLTSGTGFTFNQPVLNLVVDHNLVRAAQLVSGNSAFSVPFLLTSDPRFVDVARRDYRLSGASPAIDSGSSASVLTFDFLGATRPQGLAIDQELTNTFREPKLRPMDRARLDPASERSMIALELP